MMGSVWKRLSAFICAISAFICVFTAFRPTPSIAASISLRDDLGRNVEISAPAKRIVTLAPFLTELAFSAGAGDRVVGVSEHSDYPAAARRLPQVASSAGVSIESVAALQPAMALAHGCPHRGVAIIWRRPNEATRLGGIPAGSLEVTWR